MDQREEEEEEEDSLSMSILPAAETAVSSSALDRVRKNLLYCLPAGRQGAKNCPVGTQSTAAFWPLLAEW